MPYDAANRSRTTLAMYDNEYNPLVAPTVLPHARGDLTPAIRQYFDNNAHDFPVLAVDIGVVEWSYRALESALPMTDIYYAVKANPAPELIERLDKFGCHFDVASRQEIETVLALGVDPRKLSFGNTIKKERDIAYAHSVGVNFFAFDSAAELEKIARAAPNANVFCRILTSNEGAEWPLSRKFGCEVEMAGELLLQSASMGLRPRGISFHVGSQQTDPTQWNDALSVTRKLFDEVAESGIQLDLVNLGGGFPSRYDKEVPGYEVYGECINDSVEKYFGDLPHVKTIAEPGRGLVGDAGVIRAEVVLISKKENNAEQRWVYLDIGKFSGLAETMDESIKYRIRTPADGGATGLVCLAGNSCDSADILYEKEKYHLPLDLKVGDHVYILATGAYTTTYSSVGFNGFPPLASVVV